MLELGEGSFDVPGHGNINVAVVVMPIEGKAAVEGACPVDGEIVMLLECIQEVLSMFLLNKFNTKIIHYISVNHTGRCTCVHKPGVWGSSK